MVAGNVPVACERTNVADVDNKVRVEYLDRNTLYNPVTIYATDDASIYRNRAACGSPTSRPIISFA